MRCATPVLLPLLVLVTACGEAAPPPEEAPAEAAAMETATAPNDALLLAATRVALPPAGITREHLPQPESQAAAYLERFCAGCHALPSPGMHAAGDWPVVARRMWLRMENLDPAMGIPVPDLAERLTMLQYLMDNSLKVGGELLPDAPGRDVFERTCAQCHDLPDPKQHAPDDWFVVARRMDQHAQAILGRALQPDTIQAIVLYLREASSR